MKLGASTRATFRYSIDLVRTSWLGELENWTGAIGGQCFDWISCCVNVDLLVSLFRCV